MNYQVICGNLGADAELKSENGSEFVKFNVADTRRWKTQDGQEKEETSWVSCILNGRQENLLPYLKKGTKVLCFGQCSTRVYSSEKLRRMVAGMNLRVDRIELVGGINTDEVPRRLVTAAGELVDTFKAYFVSQEVATEQGATQQQSSIIVDEKGRQYEIKWTGQVLPLKQEPVIDERKTDNNEEVY